MYLTAIRSSGSASIEETGNDARRRSKALLGAHLTQGLDSSHSLRLDCTRFTVEATISERCGAEEDRNDCPMSGSGA